MTNTPTHNTQFGQKIGVDDVSPPKVASGRRADESRIVEDPNQNGRVRFTGAPAQAPPPEEASAASQAGVRNDAGPQDLADIPEKPSAWEAKEAED